MTWLLPSVLGIAAVAAVGLVALHFIARSRPLAEPLPTARFIPQQRVYARSRAFALSDLLLLALRLAAVAALAAAVAGPVFPARSGVTRIVVADRSRGVANAVDARDSARAYLRAGDQLVVFDSAVVRAGGSVDSLVTTSARGSLSAAFAGATRAAVGVASRTDSIEMVLVSSLSAEELDDATLKIRDTWPGRIRVVPVAAAESPSGALRLEARAAPNDAVAAGLSLMSDAGAAAAVRLVRGPPSSADTAWAGADGHVLLVWPESVNDAGWPRRVTLDTIGAASTAGGVVVARFPRPWVLDGRAVARWADGQPAAVEHSRGAGCVRDVSILIDQASDLTLHAPFRDFAAPLLAPCGGARATAPIPAATLAALAGKGALAPAAALREHVAGASRATPWLLALGALLLIAELALRRSVARGSA